MAAKDIALANAIAAHIAETLADADLPFDIAASWFPNWDQKDQLSRLQIHVAPDLQPIAEGDERAGPLETWGIDLAFAKRLQAHSAEEINAIAELIDTVLDAMARPPITLDDADDRQWVFWGWEYRARFDASLLSRQKRADGGTPIYTGSFLSVVNLQWRLSE